MKRTTLPALSALALIASLLAACSGGAATALPLPPAQATQAEAASPTPPQPSPIPPSPTIPAPTPTVPPPLMTPGFAIDQQDYLYYEQLLLIAGDSNPPVEVTQSYGVNIQPCAPCDLGIGTFSATRHTTLNQDITLQLVLYRFSDAAAQQAKMQELSEYVLSQDAVLAGLPEGSSLPASSQVMVTTAGDGALVLSEYAGFVIFAAQATPAQMTSAELIEYVCAVVELQISKLQAAGY